MQTVEGNKTGLRTEALTERIKRRDVRKFFRAFSEANPGVGSFLAPAQRVALGFVLFTCLIGLLAMAVGISQEIEEAAPDMAGQLVGMSTITGLFLFGGIMLTWVFIRRSARRGTPKRHYRFAKFAYENGMTYLPGPYEGTHVTPWADRGQLTVSRVIHPVSQRSIEFANYELKSGPAGSQSTQFGGYGAMRLSTHLPHIVLHAKGGSPAVVSAAVLPARAQRLSLEGDFDEYFSLYCPEEYERDALYLFTPDVMVRLIDGVRGFDIEIIDDWLFFVRSRDVVTLDPADWKGLRDAIFALGEKITRWERWRDDRIEQRPRMDATDPHRIGRPPVEAAGEPDAATGGLVAKPGRRLRLAFGRTVLIWVLPPAVLIAAAIVANVLD
ncbi:hypothetical protein [Glaciibacter superstes]|uniref:hypothetical protein n=1 Tax=Glaciibacter superstes TaxID=501023 RepID=UPI0004224315|nr:hypothetical protein [Glaciibacter superstes]